MLGVDNMANLLTQEELKRQINYDFETGIFTRKISTRKTKEGEVIGGLLARGYLQIAINKHPYMAHKLAWLYMSGEMPTIIDHINRVRNDNRWCNLRNVTRIENNRNVGISKRNTSGVKGVFWNPQNNNWRVRCMFNLKVIEIGSFKCIEKAKIAYQEFIKSNHGEIYFEQ